MAYEDTIIAKKEFNIELVREYSSTPFPTPLGMAHNTMELHQNSHGMWIVWDYELDSGEEEDEVVMEIEFEGKNITGYDGVFELPKEALELLREAGFNTEEVEV